MMIAHATDDRELPFSASLEWPFEFLKPTVDRHLATLRIENDTASDDCDEIADDENDDTYSYRPSHFVANMHRAPRGVRHTNRLASVLESTPNGSNPSSNSNNDYVEGLKLFAGIFVIWPFVVWMALLVALKLKYQYCQHKQQHPRRDTTNSKGKDFLAHIIPTPKTLQSDDPNAATPTITDPKSLPITSWIAGGTVIDMTKLSKAGVSRKDRKKLILRSWRIQSLFLCASIMIPVLSIVLMVCGWKPLEAAVLEIQELNAEVETLAYRGWNAVTGLEASREKLFADNALVRWIAESSPWDDGDTPEPERKPNHDSHRRRAQLVWEGRATGAPTSDFDDPIFFPWLETATQLPTTLQAAAPTKPRPSETATGKRNNHDNKTGNNNNSLSDGSFNASTSGLFVEEWCPDAVRFISTEELVYWTDSVNTLTEKTKAIHRIFNSLENSFPTIESSSSASNTSSAFRFVTETTNYVDEKIEWFFANDWLLKLLVMVLNVINGLLLANVYFFSKNNIIHPPTRLYVACVLVPLFLAAALAIVAVTVVTGVALLVNADFCAGSSGDGPQGTIEEALATLREQQQHQPTKSAAALDLVHDAVDYYWTGCLTDNPLEFLDEFSDEIDDATARLNQLALLLPIADSDPVPNGLMLQPEQTSLTESSNPPYRPKTTLSVLNKACQRDMAFLPHAVNDLKKQVGQIRSNIHKLSDTMSCGEVSPLFRRVSHGAMCVESPESLTVLWATSFGIGILCFVLLTLRAALYNSVKYKKRRPTKPRRVVEKEFEEYKEYMGQYYGETATKEWKIDGIPVPPTKLEFEFDKDLELKGTFETAKSSNYSSKGSSRDDDSSGNKPDDGSEEAGIFIRNLDGGLDDNSSYGSSYDSECSDDDRSSDDSDHGDEQSSAIGSFLSETKSIAMQTYHSLRNVKSLLSASAVRKKKNNNTLPSHVIGSDDVRLAGNFHPDERKQPDTGFGYANEIFFAHQLDAVSDIGVDDIGEREDMGNDKATDNMDDGKSVANSISDDSLYLPTPTSEATPKKRIPAAARFEKKKLLTLSNGDDFSDEGDEIHNTEDEILASHSNAVATFRTKQNWTPTTMISALKPAAPRKTLSFLARTLYTGKEHDENYVFDKEDYTNEELNSLVRPKQLTSLTSFRSKILSDVTRHGKNTLRPTSRRPQAGSRTLQRQNSGRTTTKTTDSHTK